MSSARDLRPDCECAGRQAYPGSFTKLNKLREREFLARVRLLGHDQTAIEQGEECCSYFTLPTILEARRVLSNAASASRPARQRNFFNPPVAARRRLGQGMHDRGEAVLFADGTVEETDLAGQSRHFPIHVKAISVLEKTIAAGELWDVSVRGAVWGLDDMEELYVTVNIGRLVIEEGGALVIRGNVFSLLCQEVVHCAESAGNLFQIGILPTPFSADFGHGPLQGAHGVHGISGRDGTNGRKPEVERTLLGWRLREEENVSILNGTAGEDGKSGTDGTRGRNGGMCKLAELTLRSVTGQLTVFAQAGLGGNGGDGGNGGNGGHGGNGADGHKLWNRVISDGDGGRGGNGADGGKGGHAGNGGLASNIYIDVPLEDESKIARLARPSEGGKPGHGGRAGEAGMGGVPGSSQQAKFAGRPGENGAHGVPAQCGRNGRSRPAPWIFLNDKTDGDSFRTPHPECSAANSTRQEQS